MAAVARVLMISERAVHQLAREGIIPRAHRGHYDLLACVQAYIRHIREVAAGRQSRDGKLDIVEQRARLAREQADQKSMENAILREELIPAADVEAAALAVHSAVQQRLLSVPKACAPLVAVESSSRACEAIIREHIEAALEDIADAEISVTFEPEDEDGPPPANTH